MPATMPLERLAIYTASGGSSTPFKNITLESYTFTSGRMGTSYITATLKYPSCLDSEWTGNEFVTFRGVRYCMVRIPSSSKDNTDTRYTHELKFECVRDLVLNNVYFYDCVSSSASSADRYQSNSTKVIFSGTLDEFVGRFNDVLTFKGMTQYEASIESQYIAKTEIKTLSFEDQTLFQALQAAYKLWNVPFYFDGNDIIFGEGDSEISTVLEYGGDKSLLSISKTDTDALIINRITGFGSSDNLPYYYPNQTPKGTVTAGGTAGATVTNPVKFAEKFGLTDVFTYKGMNLGTISVSTVFAGSVSSTGQSSFSGVKSKGRSPLTVILGTSPSGQNNGGLIKVNFTFSGVTDNAINGPFSSDLLYFQPSDVILEYVTGTSTVKRSVKEALEAPSKEVTITKDSRGTDVKETMNEHYLYLDIKKMNLSPLFTYSITLHGYIQTAWRDYTNSSSMASVAGTVKATTEKIDNASWTKSDGTKIADLSEYGLSCSNPSDGSTITQDASGYVTPTDRLMPSTWRASGFSNRYINALNNTYQKPDGSYYQFVNVYTAAFPKEYVKEFEDIKPSIANTGNNIIQAVYYETGYNTHDLLEDGTTMKYSAFFAKLKPLGFNLFDCGIEDGDMFVNMLDGQCGSCKFRILRSADAHKNIVQVDSSGNLVTDSNGRVVTNVDNPQPQQNDTTTNYVWLKLELDTDTFGGGDNGIMPSWNANDSTGLRVLANDHFVFTNISLPSSYVEAAELKLTHALLQFMENNNAEKYSFAIKFSRIWIAQNETFASALNEHASLHLKYNGVQIAGKLHVNQFIYKVESGVILPEVEVVIGDVVEMQTGGLERRIESVTENLLVGGLKDNPSYASDKRYIRKDIDDSTDHILTFSKGFKVGDYTEGPGGTGASMEVNTDGRSKMVIDQLIVRQLAQFTTIEIDKIRSVGGKILVSCASMVCSSVEVVSNGYKCFMELTDEEGANVANEFEVGDLAICQSFGTGSTQYYWRKVIAKGNDFITLSNESGEYADGSTMPAIGDHIVQLGNTSDTSRQGAQILSAYGDNSPSFVMYSGIDSFTLVGKDMFRTEIEKFTSGGTTTYKPTTVSYGDFYFGARDESAYVKWDTALSKLTVKGVIATDFILSEKGKIGNLVVDSLKTENPESSNAFIKVEKNAMQITDSSGDVRVKVHTGELSTSGGSSSEFNVNPASGSAYISTLGQKGTIELSLSDINPGTNKVIIIPTFTVNISVSSGESHINMYWDLYIGDSFIRGAMISSSSSISIAFPQTKTTVASDGNQALKFRVHYTCDGTDIGNPTITATKNGTQKGNIVDPTNIMEIAVNGLQLVNGGEGMILNSASGAQVVHDSVAIPIVGSSYIKRIVVCTEAEAGTDSQTLYLIKS